MFSKKVRFGVAVFILGATMACGVLGSAGDATGSNEQAQTSEDCIGSPVIIPWFGTQAKVCNDIFAPFKWYWQQYGGLKQQGYPLGPPQFEYSPETKKYLYTQRFERSVFEFHPEAQGFAWQREDGSYAPTRGVLLQQIGRQALRNRYGTDNKDPANIIAKGNCIISGGRWFGETNHCLSGVFLKYWNEHGGLAQQGLPISDPFEEVSMNDNVRRTVQYFERALFEHHTDKRGTEFEVQLALLGTYKEQKDVQKGYQIATCEVDRTVRGCEIMFRSSEARAESCDESACRNAIDTACQELRLEMLNGVGIERVCAQAVRPVSINPPELCWKSQGCK